MTENRATVQKVAGQLAKTRVVEAYKELKGFSDQSGILRFESTKAEKELIKHGLDRQDPPEPDNLPAVDAGHRVELLEIRRRVLEGRDGLFQYALDACPEHAVASR